MSDAEHSWLSDKRTVVFAVAIFLVGIVFYFAYNLVDGYRLALKTAQMQAASMATVIERHADRTVNGIGEALGSVEVLLAEYDYDLSRRYDGIYFALRNGISTSPALVALLVLDSAGHAVYSSRTPRPDRIDLSDRKYFRVQVGPRSPAVFVGEPIRGRVGRAKDRWVIPVSRRLTSANGRFLGVAAALVSVDYLADFYREIYGSISDHMALVYRDGTVLAIGAHPPEDESADAAHPGPRVAVYRVADYRGGVIEELFGTGHGHVIGHHTPDNSPFSALVALSRRRALANWRQSVVSSSLIAFFLVAVLLAAGYLSVRTIQRESAARKALSFSERRFRQLIEGSIQGVLVHRDFKPLFANRALVEMFGFDSAEEMLRHDFLYSHPPEDRSLALRRLHERMEGHKAPDRFETRMLRMDGTVIWVEVLATTVTWDNAPVVLATLIDITERKRVEAERQLLAVAIEQSAEAIIVTDTRGVIQFANQAAERITGYDRAELQGQTPRLLRSGRQEDEFYAQMWQTVSAGEVWRGRLVNRRKDGSLYSEDMTISPVRDAAGNVTHYIAVKKDITDEQQMEARLRQSQKLEAIGALAGGIAHDFNNILTPIMGYAEILQRQLPEGSREADSVAVIGKAAHRAKSLISQILLFSRQSQGRMESVSLTALMKEVIKMLRSTLPSTIEIHQELATDVAPVAADIAQVHTVLMNLGVNAGQAMPHGGHLTFRLENVDVHDAPAGREDAVPGRYVRLTVSDTGVGMDEETLQHIFEPFFTTKEVGQGTGLGLSTVYGIVQKHKGFIEVNSSTGEGSRFDVYLPAERETPGKPEPAQLPPFEGSERILFVDDEEMIGRFCKQGLEEYGFRVQQVTRGAEALELFRHDPAGFDLLITDHVMPGLSGDRLCAEVRRLRPDLPIILCSGNVESLRAEAPDTLAADALVAKPFSTSELNAAVRKVLAARNAHLENAGN